LLAQPAVWIRFSSINIESEIFDVENASCLVVDEEPRLRS